MSIFGKKQKDEDEEFEEEGRGNRKFTKKLVDLAPVNKKKRKEPPKPWGKKERMTVLIVLAATAVIALGLMISAKGDSGIRFNFPKPDFSFLNSLKEETIIIEKK
jgi:hypothetical protein